MQGYASGPDYSGKKAVLVLFINGRPVECTALKRAIEATYAAVLPKGYKPFVFLVSLLLLLLLLPFSLLATAVHAAAAGLHV